MIRWSAIALGAVALLLGPGSQAFARRCHRHAHRSCGWSVAGERRGDRREPPRPPQSTTAPAPSTSPPSPTRLPRRLEVDENDQGQPPVPYSLRPSHDPVGSGSVQFNVYNFGQDAHTFAVIDPTGRQLEEVAVPANQPDRAVLVSLQLAPGTYTLECTLPTHAALGMRAELTVK